MHKNVIKGLQHMLVRIVNVCMLYPLITVWGRSLYYGYTLSHVLTLQRAGFKQLRGDDISHAVAEVL